MKQKKKTAILLNFSVFSQTFHFVHERFLANPISSILKLHKKWLNVVKKDTAFC